MVKKINLFYTKNLLFWVMILFSISLVSAGFEFDNKQDIKNIKGKAGYYDIEIGNLYGLGEVLWKGSLEENTHSCGENCYSIQTINLTKDGVLVNDVKFETILEDGSRKEQPIRSYKFYIKTKENHWEEYILGTEKKKGIYELKLEGKKKPTRTVDFILEVQGEKLRSWAVWGGENTLYVKQNYSGNDANIFSIRKYGQIIYFNHTTILANFSVELSKVGNPPDALIEIYAVDSSNKPTGSSLSNYTISESIITTDYKLFNASLNHVLDANRNYSFIVSTVGFGGGIGNNLKLALRTDSDEYGDGGYLESNDRGSSWLQNNAWDFSFYAYEILKGMVIINSPGDNSISTSPTTLFDCSSFISNATITNMSLWTNESGIWEISNYTTGLSGNSNRTIWNHSILDGVYIFGCQACDSDGDCQFTEGNKTLTVNTNPPNIIINSPLNISYRESAIYFNITVSQTVPTDSCWYTLNNGIDNFTMMNETIDYYDAINSSIGEGSYTTFFYCNDTSNKINHTENVTFNVDLSPIWGGENKLYVKQNLLGNDANVYSTRRYGEVIYFNKSMIIANLSVYLSKYGSPPNAIIELFAVNSNNTPIGSALSFNNISNSEITESYTYINTSIYYKVDENKNYSFIIRTDGDGGDPNNYLKWALRTGSDEYGDGAYLESNDNGSSWVSYSYWDLNFYLYEFLNGVKINSPENNYESNTQYVSFNCSGIIIGSNITNRTVYIYNYDGSINKTNITIGLNGLKNTSISTLKLNKGISFNWTCKYCSDYGDCEYAEENRTITVENISPNLTINSPLNISYSDSNMIFNITASDIYSIDSCWYTLNNGIDNITLTNTTYINDYNATNQSIDIGNYTSFFYCNDSANNINNTESVSFSISRIISYTGGGGGGGTTELNPKNIIITFPLEWQQKRNVPVNIEVKNIDNENYEVESLNFEFNISGIIFLEQYYNNNTKTYENIFEVTKEAILGNNSIKVFANDEKTIETEMNFTIVPFDKDKPYEEIRFETEKKLTLSNKTTLYVFLGLLILLILLFLIVVLGKKKNIILNNIKTYKDYI